MRDYNFFELYRRKKGGNFSLRSPYFLGGLILLVCVGLCAFLIGQNMMIAKEIEDINAQISVLQSSPDYSKAVAVRDNIDALNGYDQTAEAVMEQFQNANLITTDLLQALSAEIPANVRMTEFTIDNSAAAMTFQAPNRKAVSETVLRLKESELFADVTFDTVVTLRDINAYEVVINAVMKAGEAQ